MEYASYMLHGGRTFFFDNFRACHIPQYLYYLYISISHMKDRLILLKLMTAVYIKHFCLVESDSSKKKNS